ncbi:MAG: hypothetical protein ACREOA_08190 [Candidatus Dormibacteria bacterium]
MHPIERLRYVARAGGAPPSSLVSEAAAALAGLAGDPAAMVTACKRLVGRHPQVGPMWWLASRVLASVDPAAECWAVVDELDRDPTARLLADELGESAAVVLIGWPELAGSAVLRRGDLAVMSYDPECEADGLVRRLHSAGSEVIEVPASGLAQAVAAADVVLVEALALGDSGVVAAAGSWAAAAVACSAEVPVVLVAGAGRVLPGRLWQALALRLDDDPGEPWDRSWELIEERIGGLWGKVAGPGGVVPLAEALGRADCPVVAELLGPLGSVGS